MMRFGYTISPAAGADAVQLATMGDSCASVLDTVGGLPASHVLTLQGLVPVFVSAGSSNGTRRAMGERVLPPAMAADVGRGRARRSERRLATLRRMYGVGA